MRTRLIALAVAAASVAVLMGLFLHQRFHARSATPALTALAPAAVTRLDVQAAGEPAFSFVRRAGVWRLETPVQAPADTARVATILDALGEATARHYPPSAFSLAAVGLAPPKLVLRANGVRLEFGALNPANLLRYVCRGDTVFLVMDRLFPLLRGGPWPFVDPHLLPRGAKIARIALPDPAKTDASPLIAAWETASALQVKPLAPGAAQSAPKIKIGLVNRATPLVFAVLARTPQLKLARPDLGLVYVFPAADADKLLAPVPATADARAAGSRNRPPRP